MCQSLQHVLEKYLHVQANLCSRVFLPVSAGEFRVRDNFLGFQTSSGCDADKTSNQVVQAQVAPDDPEVDRMLSIDEEPQGLSRLKAVLEAHLWPGLVVKDSTALGVEGMSSHIIYRSGFCSINRYKFYSMVLCNQLGGQIQMGCCCSKTCGI